MGNSATKRELKPLKGLDMCPYVDAFHYYDEHPNEYDKCEGCNRYKECKVTCHSPKSGVITRVCFDCKRQGIDKDHKLIACEDCHQLKVCSIHSTEPLKGRCRECLVDMITNSYLHNR